MFSRSHGEHKRLQKRIKTGNRSVPFPSCAPASSFVFKKMLLSWFSFISPRDPSLKELSLYFTIINTRCAKWNKGHWKFCVILSPCPLHLPNHHPTHTLHSPVLDMDASLVHGFCCEVLFDGRGGRTLFKDTVGMITKARIPTSMSATVMVMMVATTA